MTCSMSRLLRSCVSKWGLAYTEDPRTFYGPGITVYK